MGGLPAPAELQSARLQYRRTSRLGKGAFGDVYRGVLDEESAVAVKVLRAGSVIAARQFRRELRRYTRLSVHGVVNFYGAARSGGPSGHIDVFVTELMRGGSLLAALDAARADNTRLCASVTLRIAEMVANGLAEIHACGFSHGDVKPSNVLLSAPIAGPESVPRLRAKFVDFGLSRNLLHKSAAANARADSDDDCTEADSLPLAQPGAPAPIEPLGTPAYLAPEAWRGSNALCKPRVALAADVYALGILLYELDTGLTPWTNMSEWSIFGAVYHNAERPGWPADYEESVPGIRAIIERCWAQDFMNRPTAKEVAESLRELRRNAGLSSPSISTPGNSTPNSPAIGIRRRLEDDIEKAEGGDREAEDEHTRALQTMRMIPQPDSPLPNSPMPDWAVNGESAANTSAEPREHAVLEHKDEGDLTGESAATEEAAMNEMAVDEAAMEEAAIREAAIEETAMEEAAIEEAAKGEMAQGEMGEEEVAKVNEANVDAENGKVDSGEGNDEWTNLYHREQRTGSLPPPDDVLDTQPSIHDLEMGENGVTEAVQQGQAEMQYDSPFLLQPALSTENVSTPPLQSAAVALSNQPQSPPPAEPKADVSTQHMQMAQKNHPDWGDRARHNSPTHPTVPMLRYFAPRPSTRDDDEAEDDPRISITSSQAYADAEGDSLYTKSDSHSSVQGALPRLSDGAPESVLPEQVPMHPPPAPANGPRPQPLLRRQNSSFTSRGNELISSNSSDLRGSDKSNPTSPAQITLSSSNKSSTKSNDELRLSMEASTSPNSVPSSAFARARMKTPGNTRFVGRPRNAKEMSDRIDRLGDSTKKGTFRAPIPSMPTVTLERDTTRTAPTAVTKLDYPLKAEVQSNDLNAILNALHLGVNSADDCAHALRALALLIAAQEAHAVAAVRAGSLESLAVAVARHARKSTTLARAACDVVFHLATRQVAEVEAELRSNGACEHVIAAMRWHPTNVPVMQAASMALSALCRAGADMCEIVIAQGGLHAAHRALARAATAFDGDVPVASSALDAVAALADARPDAVADGDALAVVLRACDVFAREQIDENVVRVLHAAAKHHAGRDALLAETAAVPALAKLMERSRLTPHAGHTLVLACDVVAELASGPPSLAVRALAGSNIVESVLMAMSLVDSVEPFNAGTTLAVHSLACLRRLTTLGLDMCGVLQNAHALDVAVSVVNCRMENMDVAIQAALFVKSLVAKLTGGPYVQAGIGPALDMLRALDETWLLEVRVLEPVRQAIVVLESAQGGRMSVTPPVDTIQMATVKAKNPDRLSARGLFRWRRR